MKAAVFTLGCKVNQYESRAVIAGLSSIGFEASEGLKAADLFVINTCSVTAEADKKSRQAVARALKLNPEAKIIIAGCSSQNNAAAYLDKPSVIAVSGTAGKSKKIIKAAAQFLNSQQGENKSNQFLNSQQNENKRNQFFIEKDFDLPKIYEDDFVCDDDLAISRTKTRAYVKIQDGCNNFCSYCIVPYLRGRSRSRSLHSIINELNILSGTTKEIVLTGIDISSYGRDNGSSLAALVRAIGDALATTSNKNNGDSDSVRLRLGSLECGVIEEDLLLSLKEAGFCDHFHVSLQSGSENVLRRMNRHYSPHEFLDKIELIRRHFPYVGITTDVIAGFPGETESEHNETKQFLLKAEFSDLHVFAYSPRAGTKAFEMPQRDKKIREDRAGEIAEIKNRLKAEFIQKNIGRLHEVYAEKRDDGFVSGFTSNYIKVYTKLKAGELKKVRLTQAFRDGAKSE